MLKIRLLGTPQLYLNRAPLGGAVTGRELALLAYLAVTGTLQDRSTLSTLFWPEIGEQQARKNLRNLLYSLRQSIGDYLDSNRQTVCLRRDQIDWLDVEIFNSYWSNHQLDIGNQQLPEILGLYQGDFLQGFAIQDAPLFEDWLLMQRRTFQDQAMHGFQHLAQHHLAASDYRAGLDATRHLLTIAPWHESAHRLQMLLLAHSGQRSAALTQYALCQQALAEEYGVVPTAETTTLYMQIKAGGLARIGEEERIGYLPPTAATHGNEHHLSGTPRLVVDSSSVRQLDSRQADSRQADSEQIHEAFGFFQPLSTGLPQVNWDAIPAVPPLYGRETELSQLEGWVLTGHSRVVAVVGLGGQGKTALLAEFVHRLAEKVEIDELSGAQTGTQAAAFAHILWASAMDGASLAHILHTWLLQLAPERKLSTPAHHPPTLALDRLLAHFLHCLRTTRCLLIIDQAEALGGHGVMREAEQQTLMQLLRWVAESTHQSCLLVSSREQPQFLVRLARQTSAVRMLRLAGLTTEAGSALLRHRGLNQPGLDLALLATRYSGHPLALTLLTELVQDFPTHTLDLILQQDPLLFAELQTILSGQWQQLPMLTQEMVIWLALEQEPVAFEWLWQAFLATYSAGAVMMAYRALQEALLIEQNADRQTIGLLALYQLYAIHHLIEQIVAELQQWIVAKDTFLANGNSWSGENFGETRSTANGKLRRRPLLRGERSLASTYLNTYRLLNPHRPERIQRAQRHSILNLILKPLVSAWGVADLISHLHDLVANLNVYAVPVGRYAKSNLHTLLALLETEFHAPAEQNPAKQNPAEQNPAEQNAACLLVQETINRR